MGYRLTGQDRENRDKIDSISNTILKIMFGFSFLSIALFIIDKVF